MKNIVYVIVLIFWILSLISKSKKKQIKNAEIERIRNLNKRVAQRTETEPKAIAPKTRSPEEILGLFQAQQKQAPIVEVTDYELAYASNDYAQDVKKVVRTDGLKSAPRKKEHASHYEKNYGMTKSLGTESAEEKDAYDKDIAIIPRLSLTSGGIKQYIIASEILGKPKALRR